MSACIAVSWRQLLVESHLQSVLDWMAHGSFQLDLRTPAMDNHLVSGGQETTTT